MSIKKYLLVGEGGFFFFKPKKNKKHKNKIKNKIKIKIMSRYYHIFFSMNLKKKKRKKLNYTYKWAYLWCAPTTNRKRCLAISWFGSRGRFASIADCTCKNWSTTIKEIIIRWPWVGWCMLHFLSTLLDGNSWRYGSHEIVP